MQRIQDKIRYVQFLLDIMEEECCNEKGLYYLGINPCDTYDTIVLYDNANVLAYVKHGWDVWTVDVGENMNDVAEEIASQYFFVR